MADITMPKMGFDMTEGTIVRWLKKVGDEIKKGDAIAEIETDKVTIEIEAFAGGKLTAIVADEGAVVPVGGTIAKLDEPGGASASAPAAESASASSAAATPPQNPQAATESGDAKAQNVAAPAATTPATPTPTSPAAASSAAANVGSAPSATAQQRVIASPVAKRLAREQNLTLETIQGSGPGGRIVRKDVEAAAAMPAPTPAVAAPATTPATSPAAAPAAAPATAVSAPAAPAPARAGTRREPLSRLRQTIARRLVQSKGPVPHFYVTSEIDMTALIELRKQVNTTAETKITVNDFIVKAVALTLKQFPVLNASFAEDALEYHDAINIAIAVATDNGLLAPAVTDVDKKSLGTVSAEAKELIERTRNGKATPDELGRGTFSVSNLGMYPVDSFIAIINPPHAAILAVGAATETPVVRNGQIVIGNVMKATISVDHRVSDGAVAAQFLQALKRILENPMLILI